VYCVHCAVVLVAMLGLLKKQYL